MIKKIFLTIILFAILFVFVDCNNSSTPRISNVTPILMSIDSLPKIKNLQDIHIVKDRLYFTYECDGGYGQQILRSYKIDFKKNSLSFDKEFFKRDNNYYKMFAPITFWNNDDQLFVVEQDNPKIYAVVNDSLRKTTASLISNKAKTPYDIVLEVRQAYYKSKDEYYFIGRQPKSGFQAVFHSDNRGDSLVVKEAKRIIFDKKYPFWGVNFGTFTYNSSINSGAYAYLMFPAIEIYNFNDNKCKTIKITTNVKSFNPNTISCADLWNLNPVQYNYLTSTKQYLYALYWGVSYDTMDKMHKKGTAKSQIKMYDWKGKLKNVFIVNKSLQGISVTCDDKIIIAYDGGNFYMIKI